MEVVVFLVLAAVYFLPTIIGRKKRNSHAIGVLNLFLGWTVIGWIIALIWAVTVDQPSSSSTNTTSSPGAVPR